MTLSFQSLKQNKKLLLLAICLMLFCSLQISSASKSKKNKEKTSNENSEKTEDAFNEEEFYNHFKYYLGEFSDEFSSNPYYDLGISPWSTFDEIKAKYKDLIKKYHPDKSGKSTQDRFMKIQRAFEKIKSKRKIKNEDDFEESRLNNIMTMVIDGLFKIIVWILVLWCCKFFSELFSRFLRFIWFKCVMYYVSHLIVETFFSHLIKEQTHSLVYSAILSFLLNYLKNLVFKFINKSGE